MAVRITVEIDGEVLELTPSPKGELELLKVLQRALNTWEDPPKWALKLHDKLRDRLGSQKLS